MTQKVHILKQAKTQALWVTLEDMPIELHHLDDHSKWWNTLALPVLEDATISMFTSDGIWFGITLAISHLSKKKSMERYGKTVIRESVSPLKIKLFHTLKTTNIQNSAYTAFHSNIV